MTSESIWKKFFLLTLGSIFALHLQMANAQDESEDVKIDQEDAECVITDDQ